MSIHDLSRTRRAGLRALAWSLVGVGLTVGCVNQKITEPKRTAAEELLISTAADRAVESADVTLLQGRKTYLDTTYFDSLDKEYAIGTLRDWLFSHGVLVVNDLKEADVVVEARSGGLSIDSSEALTGVPSVPVPIPFVGVSKTPEVSLMKSQAQRAIAKFVLLAYEKEGRRHIYSTKPLVGKAYNTYYQFLGILKYQSTDIPEEKKKFLGK